MNQYAGSIQRSSQWYLEELANSKVYYFYSNNGEVNLLDVSFKQENFLHLTGIRPIVEGKKASDFVVDFAEGRGNYNQIMVSNSLKEKLQVIPMLEDILDSKSFVLDNLDEVRIAQRLNFSEAIKSKDEDFLLLFKDIGEERVPASLMKIKKDLKVDVEKTDGKVILGIFQNVMATLNSYQSMRTILKMGAKNCNPLWKMACLRQFNQMRLTKITTMSAFNGQKSIKMGQFYLLAKPSWLIISLLQQSYISRIISITTNIMRV